MIKKRIEVSILDKSVVPDYQFGFRENHSTIEQINRVTHEIRESMEANKYCNAVFLDIAKAFDKEWHDGLLHKLSAILPSR